MSKIRISGALALCVVAIATLAVGVRAYSLSAYKWAVSPVVVYLNPTNMDVTASAAETAVRSALSTWSTQSGSASRYQYGGRVADTNTAVDGRNVVIFRNASSGGALASTYSWTSGGSRVDSDVVFWDASYQFFTGTSGCSGGAYIEDVATHELGHSLGLGHSSVTEATMYGAYTWCSTAMRTLASDDLAGLQALYPGSGVQPRPSIRPTRRQVSRLRRPSAEPRSLKAARLSSVALRPMRRTGRSPRASCGHPVWTGRSVSDRTSLARCPGARTPSPPLPPITVDCRGRTRSACP